MSDWKKLRELAEAATPEFERTMDAVRRAVDEYINNWYVNEDGSTARINPNGRVAKLLALNAAANPQTVIALLDRNAELEGPVSAMRDGLHRARLTIEEHVVLMAARDEQLAAALAAKNEACDVADRMIDLAETDDEGWQSQAFHVRAHIAELRKVGTP